MIEFLSSQERGREVWTACAVFLLPLTAYLVSGTSFVSTPNSPPIVGQDYTLQDAYRGFDTFSVNDSSAVIAQSLSIINDGDLSFRAAEIPHMLFWKVAGRDQDPPFQLVAIDDRIKGWIESGLIQPAKHYPQIVDAVEPGVYLSCFGFGGAMTAAPAFAIAQWWFGPLASLSDRLDRVAFAEGSALVAASCLFLYMALRGLLTVGQAALLALAYGLGTCVFSTSSQGMWQHSATALFAGAGLWAFSRLETDGRFAWPLGACMAMATLSRPTLGIVAIAIALHLLFMDRRAFVRYALAGAPFALALLFFNYHFFGSPLKFGQTVLVDHAFEKTGVAAIWQTPILTGAAGLLLSPSRGLFVFSPFLLAAVPGAIASWFQPRWKWLRPLSIAMPVIIAIESRHFDWWGGWSYGYRHLVDLSPFLVALMAPVIARILSDARLALLFSLALAWSVFTQAIGVTANDVWGWNARMSIALLDKNLEVVKNTDDPNELTEWLSRRGHAYRNDPLNIDNKRHRDRLWSISDSQIAYSIRNFAAATALRQAQLCNARRPHQQRIAESYRHLALAFAVAGMYDKTDACYQWALEVEPGNEQAILDAWKFQAASQRNIDRVVLHLRGRTFVAPEDLSSRMLLGVALIEQGNVADAIVAFEDVLWRSIPDFNRRFDIALRPMQSRLREGGASRDPSLIQRDLTLAMKILEQYVAGRSAELSGDLAAAEKAYRAALDLMPDLKQSQLHLARIQLLQQVNQDSTKRQKL